MDDESKQTKDLTHEMEPKIVWLAVEPRHYRDAQALKSQDKESYENYVVSLIYTLDGQPIKQRPAAKVIGQITAAFEKKFGPGKVAAHGD